MSSTIVVPSAQVIGNFPPSIVAALIALATTAKADIDAIELGGVANATKSSVGVVTTRRARGVQTANVASLAAFAGVAGGTPVDGVTFVAGDIVLLVGQTTAAQNGPYVVGTVATGTAPLTRPADWATSGAIELGSTYEVGAEGTLWGGSSWKAMCTGAKVIGTDDPLFYPRVVKATVTLSSGVYALGSTEGLALFSTTKSQINATYNAPNTITLSVALKCAVGDRTAGKVGTGAATIKAVKADASTNTADVSTVDVLVTNW